MKSIFDSEAYRKAFAGIPVEQPIRRNTICLYSGPVIGERTYCWAEEKHRCTIYKKTIVHNVDCQNCNEYDPS